MNWRFARAMVRREGGASRRRLGVHMASITLGVAAVVAINSFRTDIERSVQVQARALLGADLELRSSRPFPDSVRMLLDSAEAAGAGVAYVTRFGSMAYAPASGLTRLVQVRAIRGGYPYYAAVSTEPPGLWRRFRDGPRVLVDPAVLVQLDVEPGDTVRIGDLAFTIAGVVTNVPGDVGLQTAIGARIFMPADYADATNLLQRGSLAAYYAYLQEPDLVVLNRFLNTYNAFFERHQVRYDTVQEQEEDLTDALDTLARFLGLVGLAALLLGGVGVASAVHVFVKSRLPTAALLRCLGARQSTVFAIYVAQAALMGLLGAAAGVVLGIAVQLALPLVLADVLPVDVRPRLNPGVALAGLGIGVWVALVFALFPLLAIRNAPPLGVLRREYEDGVRGGRLAQTLVLAALTASVVLLAIWQAPEWEIGVGFAVAAAVTTAVLSLAAFLAIRGTRRFFPSGAGYLVRQGIANLFRPRNQTLAVVLALGFGVFLIGTLYVTQRTLLDQFAADTRPDRPNLVLFDIQRPQRAGVDSILGARGLPVLQETPIVAARIAAVQGTPVDSLLTGPDRWQEGRWALRREYRHTWRDTLVASEEIVEGEWWPSALHAPRSAHSDTVARISMELDLAEDMGLGLGDRVTWDVQGVQIPSVITSLRRVNWARFEPNFFVVFEPGVLDAAPASWVMLTRADDARERALAQRDVVRAFPNVVSLDLTLVQQTLDAILNRVSLGVRFMALFSIGAGLLILIGAIATSRYQRLRESVLLKTLGATSRQIRRILLTEYFALGALGGLVGAGLALVAGWAAAEFLFEVPYRPPTLRLAGFWLGTAALTTVVGVLAGREALKRPPLEVLRELSE